MYAARVPSHFRLWFAVALAVGLLTLALVPRVAGSDKVAPARQPIADPQSLVAEVAAQLRLVYRDNLPEFKLRNDQLHAVENAWNASSKSAADRQLFQSWLMAAIRSSMPGSVQSLAAVPTFTEKPVVATAPQRNPSTGKSLSSVRAADASAATKSVLKSPATLDPAADPFRDDPPAVDQPTH